MDNEELTLNEILDEPEFKGVKANTLRVALKRGDIAGRQRGKLWFVTRQAIRDWLARQRDPHKAGPKMQAIKTDQD